MRITIDIVASVLLVLASFVYFMGKRKELMSRMEAEGTNDKQISLEESEGEENTSSSTEHFIESKKNKSFLVSKKTFYILHGVMLAVLVALSMVLYYVYPNREVVNDVKLLVLISGIFMVAWVDFNEYRIPNEIVGALACSRVLILIWEYLVFKQEFFANFIDCITALVLVGTFLIAVHFAFRNSIGMGDIKLLIVMAFYQGFAGVFSSVFFSLLITLILSITLLLCKKINKKDGIPFAPSALIGTYISMILTGI